MNKPTGRLLDPSFVYTPAVRTDIKATFRRHGWTPPSEVLTGRDTTVEVWNGIGGYKVVRGTK